MIEEAYVSFEAAKLLKEKGFDEPCWFWYDPSGEFRRHYSEPAKSSPCYETACPTLQMVMRWLREVHNIFICIIPCEVGAGVMDYTYVLYKIDAKDFYFKDLGIQGRAENISEISYENTVEAAIQYSLKNLI